MSEDLIQNDESIPAVERGTIPPSHEGRGGKIVKWALLAVGIICIPILYILLAPTRTPEIILPVSTAPVPALDRILKVIEDSLKVLDRGEKDYPSEAEFQAWVPKGIRAIVRTGSKNIVVLEISQGDSVWRSMTYERGKPRATTYITINRK